MTSNATPPSIQKQKSDDILVIHHLSDLAFDQDDAQHPLFDYVRYLDELDQRQVESAELQAVSKAEGRANGDTAEQAAERPELPPDLVIFTGSITGPKLEDGWQRRALREAAAALRGSLQSFRNDLRDTVFVVPGPQDVAWEQRASPLGPFAEAFAAFATPMTSAAPGSSYTCVNPPQARYAVHLFNTCPTPAELLALPRSASREVEDAIKAYQKALAGYDKYHRKNRRHYDPDLDRKLAAAVNTLLQIANGGRILPRDLEAFATTLGAPAAASEDRHLKILVTHYPLLLGTEHEYLLPRHAGPTGFGQAIALAHRHGFHLAFHGHSAHPHAFAELPLEDRQVPLRQIGSPSLRMTRSYNEIVARWNAESHHWSLEIRAIVLPSSQESQKATSTKPKATYIVLNPLADVLKPRTTRKDAETQKREDFEKELRITSRLLAEEIEDNSEEIPFTPLFRVQKAVQNIIFEGFDTVVGLVLKTAHPDTDRVDLQSQYIDPEGYGDYRFTYPFSYPTTPPAWALILERILAYPRDFGTDPKALPNALMEDDLEWLNATDRYGPTKDLLNQYLMTVRSDRELPDDVREREVSRAKRIFDAFAGQGTADDKPTLHLRDTIQHAEQAPLPFDEVIYVPVPRRPRGGYRSARTELGTLIVEVSRRKDEDGNRLRKDQIILTPEREDMLRTVSDMVYLILSTADRLDRPKGCWPHPRNGYR